MADVVEEMRAQMIHLQIVRGILFMSSASKAMSSPPKAFFAADADAGTV